MTHIYIDRQNVPCYKICDTNAHLIDTKSIYCKQLAIGMNIYLIDLDRKINMEMGKAVYKQQTDVQR